MPAAAAPEEIHSSQPSDAAVRAKGRRPHLPPQHAAMEADRPWHRPSSPPSSRSPLIRRDPAGSGRQRPVPTSPPRLGRRPPRRCHTARGIQRHRWLATSSWRRRPHIGASPHEQQQRTPR